MHKFNFYATLLNSYEWYLKSESPDASQDFLDKINRKPFESEAAEKGTAFNELTDSLSSGAHILLSDGCYHTIHQSRSGQIYNFRFPSEIVDEFVRQFKGSITQHYTEGFISTKYGDVKLYGYVDNILRDKVFDQKTTRSYTFPKFQKSWQHKVYPFTLKQEGFECSEFEYTVTDFKGIFRESYKPDFGLYEKEIRNCCEGIIEFLLRNRFDITDKKIFNNG